ncbi:MAG: FkbM family methyltransferase [Rhodobacteraceae bacterium]|nr:FkbM family methyltransferase [Paracoccaceae bacterium]
MPPKAAADDFPGRFREILSDPLNLLVRRVPEAGTVAGGLVVLHNGHRVPIAGAGAYFGGFAEILRLNRGVHEPLEEFAFQALLARLAPAPAMLELGAYWGHYSMWLLQARPGAAVHLVEPEAAHLAAGEANFARHGYRGRFIRDAVAPGRFGVDRFLAAAGIAGLDILHCDIQGHEVAMLDGAGDALARHRIGHLFVSTHSQALHHAVAARLTAAGYRIEASADFDHETTSYDGFLLAVAPDRPRVMPAARPMGRSELAAADPRAVLARLAALAPG